VGSFRARYFIRRPFSEFVSEVRELFITSTFSIILCRWLTVHLVNPAPWLTNQASKKVDIIDLTRAGDGLICLVYTLKRGGQETFGRTDDVCGPFQILCRDSSYLLDHFWIILLDLFPEDFQSHNILEDSPFIYSRILKQEMLDTIEYGYVRFYPGGLMYSSLLGCI